MDPRDVGISILRAVGDTGQFPVIWLQAQSRSYTVVVRSEHGFSREDLRMLTSIADKNDVDVRIDLNGDAILSPRNA